MLAIPPPPAGVFSGSEWAFSFPSLFLSYWAEALGSFSDSPDSYSCRIVLAEERDFCFSLCRRLIAAGGLVNIFCPVLKVALFYISSGYALLLISSDRHLADSGGRACVLVFKGHEEVQFQ